MKAKSLKSIIVIFILFIIAGIMYGITHNKKDEQQENKDISYQTVDMITNIRLGISNFDSIHPYVTNNQEAIYIDQLIFEPLLSITEDYKVSECLAKEWSRIGDKTYVIKLNENIQWQDGSKFTAEDVKFSVTKLQSQTKSVYYSNVKNIKDVEIVDENTVRIEIKQTEPFFEYNLIFPIISSKQYKSTSLNSNTIPLGTGQYKIAKIQTDKIELSRNENWRNIDTENANIKTIYINLYDTRGKEYNAFKLGSIDLIHTSNNNAEEYIGSMGYNKKVFANREYDYIALNCQNTILQYPEVRQAISKVIDKEKIVTSTLENKVTVANYPLINNSYLLKDIEVSNKTNTEKAKEILQNAGWKYEYGLWQKEIDGVTKTINIDFVVSKSNSQRVKVAQAIQDQLELFGIKINVKQVSDSQYKQYLNNKDYEMILTGVYTSIAPDLSYFLGENNLSNYKNDEIISTINEINNITDQEQSKERYAKIFGICNEQVPYIGLYYNNDMMAYSTDLMGDVKPNCYSIFYNFSNWYRQ